MNTGVDSLGRISVKRLGLAVVLLLETISLTRELISVLSGEVAVRPGGGGVAAFEFMMSVPFAYAVSGLAIVGLILFARGTRQLLGGAMVLIALFIASQVLLVVFDPHAGPNYYYGGGALLGWCVGLFYARHFVSPQREHGTQPSAEEYRYAVAGGIAVLVAMYTCAGLSKLLSMGTGWVNSFGLRAMAGVYVPPISEGNGIEAVSQWLLQGPPFVTTVLAATTLILEIGAVAMCFSARLRGIWALGLVAMHISILLVSGGTIVYGTPVVLLLVFCIPWGTEAVPESDTPALNPAGGAPVPPA